MSRKSQTVNELGFLGQAEPSTRAGFEGPGTVYGMVVNRRDSYGRITDRVIHFKTVRRVCYYFRATVGMIDEQHLTALSIVNLWCLLKGKQGGAMPAIVNWSGARRAWKARTYKAIRKAIEMGTLELVKMSRGNRVCVSPMGERVLDVYNKLFETEHQAHETDKIRLALDREAAKNRQGRIRELKRENRAA